MLSLLVIGLIINTRGVGSIIAYDCNISLSNISAISTLGVGTCDIEMGNVTTQEKYIEILQSIQVIKKAKVQECKILIHRTILYCGWSSYN